MSWLSKQLKSVGKVASKAAKPLAQGVGALGGFALGGPLGAAAGYKLGSGVGKLGESALRGSSVPQAWNSARGDLLQGGLGAGGGALLGKIGGGLGGLLGNIPGADTIQNAAGGIGDYLGGLKDRLPDSLEGFLDENGGDLGSTLRRLNGGQALTAGNLLGGAAKNLGGLAGQAGGFVKDNLGELAGAGVGALGVKEAMEADKLREQALAGVPEDSALGLTAPDDSRYRSLAGRSDAALAGLGGGTDERLADAEQGAGRYRSLIGDTDVQGRLSAQDVQSGAQAGRMSGRLDPRAVQSRLGPTDVQGGQAIGAEVDPRTAQYRGMVDQAAGGLGSVDPLEIADQRRSELGQFLDPGQLSARGEVAPSDSARLDRYRSLSDTAQAGLGGPDRTALAKQTLADLEASTARERTKGIRDIGEASAKFGRLGSGKVVTDLGNLEEVLQERSGQRANELAASVAEGDIGDRYRTLDATRQGEQSIAGEEAARRGELRGERAYGTGIESENLARTQAARMAAAGFGGTDADRALNNQYRSLGALSGLEDQAFGESQSLRGEARGERDYATGLETGNVNRRTQADMYGTDLDVGNESRRLQAEEANLGYAERDLGRQYDADTFNTGLAERNAGRRSAAEGANLDIETGNVNRRVGVGQDALGYGASVAGQGIDDRFRTLGATAGLEGQAYDEMAGDRTFNQGQATNTFNRGISRAGVRGTFAGDRDDRAEALINAGADLAGSAAARKAYGGATAGAADDANTGVAGWVRNQVGRLPGVSTVGAQPTATPTVNPTLAVQPGVPQTAPAAAAPGGGFGGRFRSLMGGAQTPGVQPPAFNMQAQQPATGSLADSLAGLVVGGSRMNPTVTQPGAAPTGGIGAALKPIGQPMTPMQPQLPAVGPPAVAAAPQAAPIDPRFRRLRRPSLYDQEAA